MPSSMEKSLDWTLEDGKWMESFDKLVDAAKPELHKLNMLKKKVRASFNIDSSIENSYGDCQVKKLKKVKTAKNKIISTPVGKLPKQPFKCSISPITLSRQELLVPEQPKTKLKHIQQRNLQSTVLNPSIVVTDYDSLNKNSQAKGTTTNDSLEILLMQPKKCLRLSRRRPDGVNEKELIKIHRNIINIKQTKDGQKEKNKVRAKLKQKSKNVVKKRKCNRNLDAALEVIDLEDTVDNNNLIEQIALTEKCTKAISADHTNALIENVITDDYSVAKRIVETRQRGCKRISRPKESDVNTFASKRKTLKDSNAKHQTASRQSQEIETEKLATPTCTNVQEKSKRISNRAITSFNQATAHNRYLSSRNERTQESQSRQTLTKELSSDGLHSSENTLTAQNDRNVNFVDQSTNLSTKNASKLNVILSKDRGSFVNTQRRSKRTIIALESEANRNTEFVIDTSKDLSYNNGQRVNGLDQSVLEKNLQQDDIQITDIYRDCLPESTLTNNTENLRSSDEHLNFSSENTNPATNKSDKITSILSQDRESFVNTQRRSKRTLGGRETERQTSNVNTNISKENSNAKGQNETGLLQNIIENTLQQVDFGSFNLLSDSNVIHIPQVNEQSLLAQNSKPITQNTNLLPEKMSELNSILNKDRESFINTQRRSKRTIERRQTKEQQGSSTIVSSYTIKTKTRENINNSTVENLNVLQNSSIEKRQMNSLEKCNLTASTRVSSDAKNTTEVIENTFITENVKSSVPISSSMEKEVCNKNLSINARTSHNEKTNSEIIEESINHTKSSFVVPRKRVKFSEIRQNNKIQLQNTISEDPNNDSDIILIEPIEKTQKVKKTLSFLQNKKSQQLLESSAKIFEPLKPIRSFKTQPAAKLYDEPLRPIKSFNNRTNPRDLTTNISIQPGKWRKSLNALRRTQLSQVQQSLHRATCQLEKIIDEDESVEYVTTTTFIGIRKTIILKDEDNTLTTQQSFIDITNYKETVLKYCDQTMPLNFENLYSKENMKDCIKIGEGVYGEVFMKKSKDDFIVCKIIPIEGTLMVNGEVQKTFEQILPEIVISKELCRLKEKTSDAKHSTAGFVDVKKVSCVEGKYPEHLIKCWEEYDNEKTSENDHPEEFDDKQLFIVLELEFAGKDLETFTFDNAEQSFAALQQIILTIAVAEEALQFEHRDLHWGNVLIKKTNISEYDFKICGETLTVPTKGIKTTIIDYTLSRIKYDNHCFYNDLTNDEELFTATGDYQFDIYRMMRKVLGTNWERFEPKTNIFWISYLISKMLIGVHYKETRSKIHAQYLRKMRVLKKEVLEFDSASSFAKYLIYKL